LPADTQKTNQKTTDYCANNTDNDIGGCAHLGIAFHDITGNPTSQGTKQNPKNNIY
jgi:hypothetical protein